MKVSRTQKVLACTFQANRIIWITVRLQLLSWHWATLLLWSYFIEIISFSRVYKFHAFVSPVLSLFQKHRERTHRSLSLTQTVLGHEVSSHQCSTILTWLTLCFPMMAFEASHRKEMLRCCALHLFSVSICFYLPHDWPMQLSHLRKSTWSVCSTANKYSVRKKNCLALLNFDETPFTYLLLIQCGLLVPQINQTHM